MTLTNGIFQPKFEYYPRIPQIVILHLKNYVEDNENLAQLEISMRPERNFFKAKSSLGNYNKVEKKFYLNGAILYSNF